MAFDWRDFLDLAKTLIGQGSNYSTEAASRTAVSRAYYAAFCWARNYAESQLEFQKRRTPEDHRELREYLKRRGSHI
jgi:uncharacterized protein (UPF0332 family)